MFFAKTFFLLDLNQNNVITNLADTFPGDHILAFSSKKAAQPSRSGDHQRCDLSGLAVKFHINGTAQTPTGTGINDFFLFQLT